MSGASLTVAGSEASLSQAMPSLAPGVIVAQGFSDGPLPLSLDRPLELRGGEALGPDRLVAGLPLDWHPDLLAFVAVACRRQAHAGRAWLSMPPLALIGPGGSGRTHAARMIARHAGLPFVSIDVSSRETGGRPLEPTHADFRGVALPTAPVLAMAAAGCANPVILLKGVEHADEETLGELAAMIDPVTAERRVEHAIRATVDLRQVSWILPASNDLRFPRALDAATRVHMPQLSRRPEESRMVAVGVVAEVMADLGIAAEDVGGGMEEFVRIVGRDPPAFSLDWSVAALRARILGELGRSRRR